MHHLTRAVLDYFLDVNQESQPKNIDSEDVVVRNQEMQISNEASSTGSSFYLVSEGIMENSSMPSKNESTHEPDMSSLSRRLDGLQLDDLQRSGARYPDHLRKSLERELGRLQAREAKMIRRINRRMQELVTLKTRDEEEKWEDDLFETRMKELEAANAIIETRSSFSKEDISIRVKEINEKIIRISSVLVVARSSRPHISFLSDAVTNALGPHFFSFLQKAGYFFEEQTIKALLQIYLARSCATVICAWNPEKYLDRSLDQLYNLIAVNGKIRCFCIIPTLEFMKDFIESQVIAGKWRQMAFRQLPHGPDQEALQKFTINIVHMILTIASCAGWGKGDASEIQPLIQELVVNARTVREYAKAGVIPADVQAWVAHAGDMYDPATMEGALNESEMGSRVLGSTGIGLSVRYVSREDGVAFQTLLPSKVFCIRG
jgi:hypothetical protein